MIYNEEVQDPIWSNIKQHSKLKTIAFSPGRPSFTKVTVYDDFHLHDISETIQVKPIEKSSLRFSFSTPMERKPTQNPYKFFSLEFIDAESRAVSIDNIHLSHKYRKCLRENGRPDFRAFTCQEAYEMGRLFCGQVAQTLALQTGILLILLEVY